jgi:HEPN domain-containing protein
VKWGEKQNLSGYVFREEKVLLRCQDPCIANTLFVKQSEQNGCVPDNAMITNTQINQFILSLGYNTIISLMDDKINYWKDLSNYDLETAEAMLHSKRFLYVGFMCHQTIEKIFKAYYYRLTSDAAPFSHSLSYIARKGGFYENFSEDQQDFIDQLEPLNIEARYPSHKERLLKSLTYEKCTELIEKTQQLQQWIESKL